MTALRIGLTRQFANLPPPADPHSDDAISIATSAADGVIAGTNPRSVPLAVFRYLHLLSCHWTRATICWMMACMPSIRCAGCATAR